MNKTAEQWAAEDYYNGLSIAQIAEIYSWNLIQTMTILQTQGIDLTYRREVGQRRTKVDILAEIAQKLGIAFESVQSLEKADKSALETLAKAL